ncbi:MAG: magnesium transporter MgtE N-terminal domain-containing protein, partial [Thermomicrobiales bacterium]
SAQGILRRLGPAKLTGDLPSRSLIDWADVESFATQAPMVRLRVSQAGLARLHPVEIAQIVEALSPRYGHEVIRALDDETAADTVQELDPDEAADLLELMDPEHAADILEEMELNDAADVLAEMTDADSDELLELMGPEESADVRELLDFAEQYDADTAAGLMTTDFVSVAPNLTAAQCLAGLRAIPDPPEPLYHLYLATAEVTPGRQPLVGVVALRDVVLADPSASLDSFKDDALLTVRLEEPARSVAHKMAEYNLATIPVIDREGCILGVVHIDDAMDVLLPDLWSRRTRRLFT